MWSQSFSAPAAITFWQAQTAASYPYGICARCGTNSPRWGWTGNHSGVSLKQGDVPRPALRPRRAVEGAVGWCVRVVEANDAIFHRGDGSDGVPRTGLKALVAFQSVSEPGNILETDEVATVAVR